MIRTWQRNTNHRRSCLLDTSGTAALELVIVLPLLMVIVIGATDLSRAMHYENVLSNAAREGAAFGATHQVNAYLEESWRAQIIERATEEASHLPRFDIDELQVAIQLSDDVNNTQRVQVTVSYPFELLIRWPAFPRRILLEKEISMRGYR